jgi:pyruvate,orthophosphate dikinase
MEVQGRKDKEYEDKQKLLRRVEQLHEFNPMLGHRGVRLGITYPEITEMQTRAILEAACDVTKEGGKAVAEIMIPLVGDVRELRDQSAIVRRVAADVMKEKGVKVTYLVGTMFEVPRGSLTADEIAREAEFFSFGTNDLTQLTYGFSRDDFGKVLEVYRERRILERDPFVSLDTEGVGQLVDMGVRKGRSTRPDLKIGVCGEHGGDPASIHFFHRVGLNYVSCGPFSVPVARLAAAQAALKQKASD